MLDLLYGGDRRFFQRYLKHFVGYADLSDIPESDMPDTTVFRTCGYNNLISLHLMFTKLDMIDNQLVLANFFE